MTPKYIKPQLASPETSKKKAKANASAIRVTSFTPQSIKSNLIITKFHHSGDAVKSPTSSNETPKFGSK
jgi:hypothetical protein